MKKKLIIILTIIISILFIICIYRYNKYAYIIQKNWNINIPFEDKLIYQKENTGIRGEGIKYTILKYNNDYKIKKLKEYNWTMEYNISEIDSTIKNLNIEEKYSLNSNKQYLYFYHEENESKIYILFSIEKNKLYIIEQII